VTWSYDPNQLAASELYQIRFELQDTDPSEMLIQDEEIRWIITQESTLTLAAARGAEIIARLFARQADSVTNPTVKLEFKSRVKAYHDLATTLRKRASAARAPVLVSTSQSAKDAAMQNTDRTGPYFRRGMMDRYPDNDSQGQSGFATGNDPIFSTQP
jgi:hypothetical protein